MVSWLKKCGVNKNDYIAIQASASFPALTFASIIACETLKLKPFISVSLGASSYGANLPEFTFLDMEKILVDSAAIMDKSSLVTPGGTNDNGSSMWPGAVEILLRSVQRNGKSLFTPKTLHESIEKKWNFFNNAGDIRVFINIGGNHASLGNGQCALRIQSGLIDESLHCAQADSDDGLIQKFNHSGIPVIHLLNIRELAARNGIPIIPPRMQPEGESDVYFTKNKPLWLYAISLVIACGVGVYLKI
jgi:poly-gamma-glutamate system protein